MGCAFNKSRVEPPVLSPPPPPPVPPQPKFQPIQNKFKNIDEIQEALRQGGLESSSLIFAIDFTRSNLDGGKHTHKHLSLHHLEPNSANDYEIAIQSLGEILEPFDDDKMIPAFGFGDIRTKQGLIFSLHPENQSCHGFEEVLQRYRTIVPHVTMCGPTSFSPIIRRAIQIVQETGDYHILVIVTDGGVNDIEATEQSIVYASNYPLSIVVIGVGDGEVYNKKTKESTFPTMNKFDNQLTDRHFDNYQFVNFNEMKALATKTQQPFNLVFGTQVLMEIPEQFVFCKQKRYLLRPPLELKYQMDNKSYVVPPLKIPPVIAASSTVESKNDELKKKKEDQNKPCDICMDHSIEYCFDPCGHRVCGEKCVPKTRQCPWCQREIIKLIKLF